MNFEFDNGFTLRINNDPVHRRVDASPGQQKLIKVEMSSIKNRLTSLFTYVNTVFWGFFFFNKAVPNQVVISY